MLSTEGNLSRTMMWSAPQVAATGQGMVPNGHTCARSTLAQSYGTARKVRRKLGFIN